MNLYLALLHYPVYNRKREVVVTSVVVHDVHDISRASRTYGVNRFYIVQPFEEERKMVERVITFWNSSGLGYNLTRAQALSVVSLKESFGNVLMDIKKEFGEYPLVIGTSAQAQEIPLITFQETAQRLKDNEAVLLLFGTGWGIALPLLEKIDCFLPPIVGIGEFNHLSVRSAASIVLDRIVSLYKEL